MRLYHHPLLKSTNQARERHVHPRQARLLADCLHSSGATIGTDWWHVTAHDWCVAASVGRRRNLDLVVGNQRFSMFPTEDLGVVA